MSHWTWKAARLSAGCSRVIFVSRTVPTKRCPELFSFDLMHPIVAELAGLIEKNAWGDAFGSALSAVADERVAGLEGIDTLDSYLSYLERMVRWTPHEEGDSHVVQDKLLEFFFILDQPKLKALQTSWLPDSNREQPTPLSSWIRSFAVAWGSYLDTPESASGVQTFRTNPKFHWDDYMPPPSGYLTFNQFFARHPKPGCRPVDSLDDQEVLVSPVDGSFIGQWHVADDSNIEAHEKAVNAKGLRWSIAELLRDSAYAERFAGGLFMHSALRTFDYHRFHSPVAGTVWKPVSFRERPL